MKHVTENPFFVLELTPSCSLMDIERAGQKWLSMLKVGMAAARVYKTPVGEQPRDEDAVRRAMADLRDPALFEKMAFWAHRDAWRAAEMPAAKADVPRWLEAHQRLRTLDREESES